MRLSTKSRPEKKIKWNPQVVSVSLNSDSSCVSIGSQRGFRVCQLSPFKRHNFNMKGGIGICEMLGCSSLIAIVGGGDSPAFSSRRLRVFNTSTSTAIREMNFDYPIVAVRLNTRFLVVVLALQVHIFNIDTMKKTQVLDTPHNPHGLCTLQTMADNSSNRVLLCFPGSTDKGDVVVFNLAGQKVDEVVEAHQTPIAAMVLSSDGHYLATASVKGTLIRIFDVSNGKQQIFATFRRGVTSSTLMTMRFNSTCSLLCCGSKNGTVHVFDINAVVDPLNSVSLAAIKLANAANPSTASTAKAAAQSLFTGLIETLPTVISSHRSSCSVNIDSDVSFICGFISVGVGSGESDISEMSGGNGEVKVSDGVESETTRKKDCIVVVTSAGIVSIYSMNFVDGTGVLENQHMLLENKNQQESTTTALQ
jgi:autophagy-related protein 18